MPTSKPGDVATHLQVQGGSVESGELPEATVSGQGLLKVRGVRSLEASRLSVERTLDNTLVLDTHALVTVTE